PTKRVARRRCMERLRAAAMRRIARCARCRAETAEWRCCVQAIRVHETGGPEVLELETIDDPVPGPGEALVRMDAIGVNFIEVYYRKGLYKMSLPFTPGSEGAGVVVAIGEGSTDV